MQPVADVYVAGGSAFCSAACEDATLDRLKQVGVAACREIGLSYAKLRWVRQAASWLLLYAELSPVLGEHDRGLMHCMATAIAAELIK